MLVSTRHFKEIVCGERWDSLHRWEIKYINLFLLLQCMGSVHGLACECVIKKIEKKIKVIETT